MNHFSLVKYHPCVQLAHLYEHLFITTVTEYLYHHGQYKLLDYALNGETHTSGVLLVQGECYNTEVSTLLENIATMPADLNSGSPGNLPVAKAMSQLLAESANDLYIGDPDEIISELALLNSMPWKPLDTIDLLPKPAATVNNSTDLIYETNQSTKKAPNIELSLSITEQPIELRIPQFIDWTGYLPTFWSLFFARVCQKYLKRYSGHKYLSYKFIPSTKN